MALEVFANDGIATVTSGGTTAPSAGTSETWTVDATIPFAVASSSATPPTVFYVADQASASETEKILVTACPGGTGSQTWTVTRGADGTSTVTHTSGFTIQQVVTRASLEALQTETVDALGSVTGTATVNLANGDVFTATLTGNTTFTFSGATAGVACPFTLYLSENGTGGYTVTWPGSVSWIGGGAPSLNTAASALNVLTFETVDGGTTWYGSMVQELPSLPMSVANGGTGQNTQSAAMTALAGSQTTGYYLRSDGTNTALAAIQSSDLPLTDTSGTATASTPTFVSGTAKQVNTTQDTILYISVATATKVAIAIGSTSSVNSAILASPGTAQVAGTMFTVRVPKGWYVKITSSNTIADLTFTAVTC